MIPFPEEECYTLPLLSLIVQRNLNHQGCQILKCNVNSHYVWSCKMKIMLWCGNMRCSLMEYTLLPNFIESIHSNLDRVGMISKNLNSTQVILVWHRVTAEARYRWVSQRIMHRYWVTLQDVGIAWGFYIEVVGYFGMIRKWLKMLWH